MITKYNYTTCLLIKNENKYLNEWLNHHISIGIEHFYIYDNGEKESVQDILKNFSPELYTVIDWHSGYKHMQIDAYNHCLKNYGNESRWIAFIDTDEFIECDNISFLNNYEKYSHVKLYWNIYDANGQVSYSSLPVRERFTHVAKGVNIGINYKSIVQPKYIIEMFVHEPRCIIDGCFVKDTYISHYYTKSLEEWIEKIKRGTCSNSCYRKYNEFFNINQNMQQYYNSSMKQLEQSYTKGYKYDIRIMAHPSRRDNVLKILSQLKMDESIVIYDDRGLDKADALYTAKKAWLSPITDPLVTHRIVLQDDILLADNFKNKCTDIVNTVSDSPIMLFDTYFDNEMDIVKNRNSVYFSVNDISTTQAIIMPVTDISPCFNYIDDILNKNCDCLHDDIMIGKYFRSIRRQIYAIVPNLVQHIGSLNSLIKINGYEYFYTQERISKTFLSHPIDNYSIFQPQPIDDKQRKRIELIHKRYEQLKQKYNL